MIPISFTTRTLSISMTMAGKPVFQLHLLPRPEQCDTVCVHFNLLGKLDVRQALRSVQESLQQAGIEFLRLRGKVWSLDLDAFSKVDARFLSDLNWAVGTAIVKPEVEYATPPFYGDTYVKFNVYKEEHILERAQKIFLSHKGSDKPTVRRFFTVLKSIGFLPWLDEDAMTAGTELERGILQGFKDSCAAVFFITPNFKDESYLRTEVNYALYEKRSKEDRFAIITIVFTDKRGKGLVPEPLKQFVWKEPETELDAMNEILRALPIEPSEPRWRM